MLKFVQFLQDSSIWEASTLGAVYLGKVLQELQRPLSASECDTVSKFFLAGYSVNYTVEYLR